MKKNKILRIIKKNGLLFALLKVLRNRKDKDYINSFSDMTDIVRIVPCGSSIGKAPIYNFDIDKICGLFWYLRLVLEVLYYCDNMGFVPQIHWSKSLYYDDTIKSTTNPFEYYFIQPFSMSKQELQSRSIVQYAPGSRNLARKLIGEGDIYVGSEEYTKALAAVARKALCFNPETNEVINSFVSEKRICDDVLGVHIRGTDFRKKFKGHPVFVGTSEFYKYVDEAILLCGFKRVYLATDDQKILDEFLEHYKDIEIVYSHDAHRGDGNQGIHVKAFIDSKTSAYSEGLIALCDMIALSKCGGLISGISNLPLIARIFKKSENSNYLYDVTINKGFHEHGINADKRLFSELR